MPAYLDPIVCSCGTSDRSGQSCVCEWPACVAPGCDETADGFYRHDGGEAYCVSCAEAAELERVRARCPHCNRPDSAACGCWEAAS